MPGMGSIPATPIVGSAKHECLAEYSPGNGQSFNVDARQGAKARHLLIGQQPD